MTDPATDRPEHVNVALIGCGFFARNHLHAWRDIPGAELVALCDSDPERLGAAARDFGVARTHTDARDLFAQGGFDVVDIATTAPSHRMLVELAARHGVHVICQKPFAQSLADARAMVDAVAATGKTLMVHENFRWQSPIRAVIDALRSGAIGTPFFGRISFRTGFDVYAGQPYLAQGDRLIVEDLGIHLLDVARALFGDVRRLSATTRRVNPAIRGEDVATMLLEHAGGTTSVVDCSFATHRLPETFPETLIEIDGTSGTLRLDAGYGLRIDADGATTLRDLSPPLLPWATKPWHNVQESVLLIQRDFVACLRDGRHPETSGADNLRTLALVEAAYLSAAERRMVEPDGT